MFRAKRLTMNKRNLPTLLALSMLPLSSGSQAYRNIDVKLITKP
jgi:hypothetical protein